MGLAVVRDFAFEIGVGEVIQGDVAIQLNKSQVLATSECQERHGVSRERRSTGNKDINGSVS